MAFDACPYETIDSIVERETGREMYAVVNLVEGVGYFGKGCRACIQKAFFENF